MFRPDFAKSQKKFNGANLIFIQEWFDKEQTVIKEPFSVTNLPLIHKDKELLSLRNNFRATKKFLIAKFDCIMRKVWYHQV